MLCEGKGKDWDGMEWDDLGRLVVILSWWVLTGKVVGRIGYDMEGWGIGDRIGDREDREDGGRGQGIGMGVMGGDRGDRGDRRKEGGVVPGGIDYRV